jgi:hypothetical protein
MEKATALFSCSRANLASSRWAVKIGTEKVMPVIPATVSLTARLRTKEKLPDISEFREANVDHNLHDFFPGTVGEVRFQLTRFSLARIGEILQRAQLTIGFAFLDVRVHDDFWERIPADCAGGFLRVDGYVSFPQGITHWKLVPLSEPLYTDGRPDSDVDHSRHQPHVLSSGGGIPILSNRLIRDLEQLGVVGEAARIIYRGCNKKAYDTPQPGFKRYLPNARFEMIDDVGMDFLPENVPDDFPISGVLRHHANSWRDQSERWYEIALPLEKCLELREMIPGILFSPIFRRDGVLHQTQLEFAAMIAAVNAARMSQ